jgi:Rrf2 family transcriptional regulator, cysteine metabolism repressor
MLGIKVKAMKFSTRSKYGLNAMFELARKYGSGPVSVKDISELQQIPEAYLEQLFMPLKKAGIINAARGAQGGYTLSGEPASISVGSIIRALEGPISIADCLEDDGGGCERGNTCPGKIIWEKIYKSINGVIDSLTLADILGEYELRNKGDI